MVDLEKEEGYIDSYNKKAKKNNHLPSLGTVSNGYHNNWPWVQIQILMKSTRFDPYFDRNTKISHVSQSKD